MAALMATHGRELWVEAASSGCGGWCVRRLGALACVKNEVSPENKGFPHLAPKAAESETKTERDC